MKSLSLWLVCFFALFAFSLAFPEICIYKGRQLTKGQQVIDCYVKATCMAGGKLKKGPSCPSYSCIPKSKVSGYKRFDPSQPHPHCCGGEICEDRYKIFYKAY